MRNSRNGNGRSSRHSGGSNRHFSDQTQYDSPRGSDYRYRDENDNDRDDDNRGQDQDYDRRHYGNRGSQSQPYGSDYDRDARNDYGNNSYTDNEGYEQGRSTTSGQYGGYDQNFESNDWRWQQGGPQDRRWGQDNWREREGSGLGSYSGSYGSGSYGNEGRNYSQDYGRMGGNYGRGSSAGGTQWRDDSRRGSSSFNTNRSGRWGNSVESMRGKGPKGYRRSDERIQEQLNDVLTDDDMLDASGIEVTVKNGEVTLSGTVSSREAKRRAEDLVEGVSEVTNVENRIRVSNESSSENRGMQNRSSKDSEENRSGQSNSQNKNKSHQNAEA